MKKQLLHLFWLLVLLTFSTCKRENMCDCIKGTGKRISQTRDLASFSSLLMKDNMDVYFTQSLDGSFEVVVEAGKQLVDLVKTKVDTGLLTITNNNVCNWMRSYEKGKIKVFIKAPQLLKIINDGSGNFYSENTIHQKVIDYYIRNYGNINLQLQCDVANGHFHGAGDANVSGSAKEHTIHCTGQSFVLAHELQTVYTWIYHNSSGTIRVKVSDKLIANLYNIGNAHYSGNPTIIEHYSYGKGQLIQE